MSMKVSTRQVDGVTIVDCSGRITLGEGSVILKDTVRELLSKGQKRILLNLGDVNYIDSSGIGELVSAFTTARNQGGDLKLLNLTKKVHDLLQITKLYTVFDVKDEEAAAVKSPRQTAWMAVACTHIGRSTSRPASRADWSSRTTIAW